MAQTESEPGLSPSWVADRISTIAPDDGASPDVAPEPPTAKEHVTPDMIEATTPAPTRRPNKFMAELSKAMQTAAENARDETMVRFEADSKTAVEDIQAASTVDAAALRRRADDDCAAVREWSKIEIARIREETEARIAARKTALDGEMEASASVVEARVARVAAAVDAFQADMVAFFERLMAEQDPTRIATMAETMPDPPDLAVVAASIAEPVFEPFDPLQQRSMMSETVTADAAVTGTTLEPVAEPSTDQMAEAEAALAARLQFAAAEAEALAFTGDLDDETPTPSTAPHAKEHNPIVPELAQADAGTLPSTVGAERTTTRVVVRGLVSVASIATFKRSLSRTEGVASVSVASGPDGEFVFTVDHDAGIGLAAAVAALPGFEARITAESVESIEVEAHDPDTGD